MPEKSSNHPMWKLITLSGFVSCIVPVSIYGMWIHAFSLGTTQAQRVAIFSRYFPDFLQDPWSTALLSIAFCVLAIVASSISLKASVKAWKILNTTILVLSSLLLLLDLFSLM